MRLAVRLLVDGSRLRAVVAHLDHLEILGGRTDSGVVMSSDAGSQQHGIANFLGIQPAWDCAAKSVCWPDRMADSLSRGFGAELIGPRQHDRSHQLLDRPAIVNESVRQVIEQFRVGRVVARDAEIIDGARRCPDRTDAPRRD